MIKSKFLFLFLLCFQLLCAQNEVKKSLFDNLVKQKAAHFHEVKFFKSAALFYIAKNYDATLVNSMKYLNSNDKNPELTDFCHFFRGVSFYEKKIYTASAKEFNLVSKNTLYKDRILFYLGSIALEQFEYYKALVFFDKAEKSKNTIFISRAILNQNLGVCYLFLKQYKQSEHFLLIAKPNFLNSIDTIDIITANMNIANLYYEQFKDKLAIPYFERAYFLSNKSRNYDLKMQTSGNMATVEENRKNYQKAIIYRKEYDQWKDSVNNQTKIWLVAETEKKFEVNQKQKEIQFLEAENKIKETQRNGMFLLVFLLSSIFIIGIYFYKQKIKSGKIIEAQKEALASLNDTKDRLFSIVSHDLRSSVNALKTSNSSLLNNLEEKNYEQLDKLLHQNNAIANSSYNLLDNLLNWSLQQTNQQYFYQESHYLFACIQQVAYNYKPLMKEKNIQFENRVAKSEMVFLDLESLKIVLRNLLDNAIKFSKINGTISIYSTHSEGQFCRLIIEDNGIGMSKNTLIELTKDTHLLSKKSHTENIGTGLGLQLCKTMTHKNGGKLTMESIENIGTKMILDLPKTKI